MSDPSGATDTAHKVIDALRSAPVMLMVIVLNIVFIAAIGYYLVHQTDHEHERILKLLDACAAQKK